MAPAVLPQPTVIPAAPIRAAARPGLSPDDLVGDGPPSRRAELASASAAAAAVAAAPAVTFPALRPRRASDPRVVCGACQSVIADGEEQATCPSCGLRFHADCWHEKYGCSAYGSPQVDALAPPEPEPLPADAAPTAVAPDLADAPKPRTPFVLLAASVAAAILSAVSFGAASLAVLIVSLAYRSRHRRDPRVRAGVVLAAVGLSAAGLAAGAAVSYFVFVYGRR